MTISGSFYLWGERAKNVQAEAAVYELYDESYQLIFVGDSSNLRQSFAKYLETGFSGDECKVATKYYKREFTSRPKERREEILAEYMSEHGTAPKGNIAGGEHVTMAEKTVGIEKGFFFYEDLGKPLHKVAVSLGDFLEQVKQVPVVSLEFHQNRGDFARWIRSTMGAASLAGAIEPLKDTGEDLRKRLVEIVSYPEGAVLAKCPRCETTTRPKKIWSMAGRPSRTGEQLKLTIGYYRCYDCDKSFRKVIAKEKVRS